MDFGPGLTPEDGFASQHDFNKIGPMMNSEYYVHIPHTNIKLTVSKDRLVNSLGRSANGDS